MMISQYLSPAGFVVSLQNCMNEETIAGVVGCEGWSVASLVLSPSSCASLAMSGAPRVRAGRGISCFVRGRCNGHTTAGVREACRLVGLADSARVTANLWGERWSKLVVNAMANGISACSGLPSVEMVRNYALRRFATKVGSEAIRVGQALGYQLELIHDLDPEIIAKAGEGDADAAKLFDERRLVEADRLSGGEHRPSMGQDIMKSRRTEIDLINGLIVRSDSTQGRGGGHSSAGEQGADRYCQARRAGRTCTRPPPPDGSSGRLTVLARAAHPRSSRRSQGSFANRPALVRVDRSGDTRQRTRVPRRRNGGIRNLCQTA